MTAIDIPPDQCIWTSNDTDSLDQDDKGSIVENDPSYVLFRSTFDLNTDPVDVILKVAAWTAYTAYVNGQRVCWDLSMSETSIVRARLTDISSCLAWGTNVVAVRVAAKVFSEDGRGPKHIFRLAQLAALWVEVEMKGSVLLTTQPSWNYMIDRGRSMYPAKALIAEITNVQGSSGTPVRHLYPGINESIDCYDPGRGWAATRYDDRGWIASEQQPFPADVSLHNVSLQPAASTEPHKFIVLHSNKSQQHTRDLTLASFRLNEKATSKFENNTGSFPVLPAGRSMDLYLCTEYPRKPKSLVGGAEGDVLVKPDLSTPQDPRAVNAFIHMSILCEGDFCITVTSGLEIETIFGNFEESKSKIGVTVDEWIGGPSSRLWPLKQFQTFFAREFRYARIRLTAGEQQALRIVHLEYVEILDSNQ